MDGTKSWAARAAPAAPPPTAMYYGYRRPLVFAGTGTNVIYMYISAIGPNGKILYPLTLYPTIVSYPAPFHAQGEKGAGHETSPTIICDLP